MQSAYNVGPLYASGFTGAGQTIAIVDSYGSDTIAHDLHVYDQAFGLQPLCGEEGVTCSAGMPTFSQLALQGSPATKAPPAKSKGTGLENKAGWALEVSLDVETAHAIAPMANILLVTTPTAETLGVQGFPQMMSAEDYVVQHHLATVISQSFASAEGAFGSAQSLQNLRYAFIDAAQNGVTVLGSSGDNGTANVTKSPVKSGRVVDPVSERRVACLRPARDRRRRHLPVHQPSGGHERPTHHLRGSGCEMQRQPDAGRGGLDVLGWRLQPDLREARLPEHASGRVTPIGANRGVPDVALQASAGTGGLVYITLPPDGLSGLICGSAPCSTGWYDIGGTSLVGPTVGGTRRTRRPGERRRTRPDQPRAVHDRR